MNVVKEVGTWLLKEAGLNAFVNEVDGDKITLFFELDAAEFLKPGMFDEQTCNPDTRQIYQSVSDQLEDMSDKDLLLMAIDQLKQKLQSLTPKIS